MVLLAAASIRSQAANFFHLASLSILDNVYLNFPPAGAENKITTDPADNPRYTNTGNGGK